jgi:hypothetical protein
LSPGGIFSGTAAKWQATATTIDVLGAEGAVPGLAPARGQWGEGLPGLPVIKLHEGRHSAASLARDAEVDSEIRRRTLGHADAAMTAYTHIEAEAHKVVAKLVERAS